MRESYWFRFEAPAVPVTAEEIRQTNVVKGVSLITIGWARGHIAWDAKGDMYPVAIDAEQGRYFPVELKLARDPGVKPAPWYERPQEVMTGRVFGPARKPAPAPAPEAAPGPDPRLRPELQRPVGGAPPSVERGERGALEFHVTPEIASVYVDGEFLGTGRELAQMERGFAVSAGAHTVEVVAPRHTPRTVTVTVEAGASQQIVVELEIVTAGQN